MRHGGNGSTAVVVLVEASKDRVGWLLWVVAMGGCYGWKRAKTGLGGCYGWLLWVVVMGGCYGWLLWVEASEDSGSN